MTKGKAALGVIVLSAGVAILATIGLSQTTGQVPPPPGPAISTAVVVVVDTPVPTAAATDTPVPMPTDTLVPTVAPTETPMVRLHNQAWYAANASADTFSDLDNHPQEHFADVIVWGCTVSKILGPNAHNPTWTDISCSVDPGVIGGGYSSALPEAVLLLDPNTINVNAINPGDHITISGYAAGSYSGTNSFGASISEPAIVVTYVDTAPAQSGQS